MVTYFGASSLRDIIDGKDATVYNVSFSPNGLYLAIATDRASMVRVSLLIFCQNKFL